MGAEKAIDLLLIGPSGTGKTASVRNFLSDQPKDIRKFVEMTFSAKTEASTIN
jgi:Cdc6-like AAA superfamily ATPase